MHEYEYLWLSYFLAGELFSPTAQVLFPQHMSYSQAIAVLHTHGDHPSERMVRHLIPRHEVSNLPQYIESAVANAYSILGDYVEAVDITATVLMRIEQSSREPRDIKSYLIVAVRNEALRRAKWRKRHEQLSDETLEKALSLVTFNTPEQELIRKELCTRLRRVVDTLPLHQRELIHLYFYEGLTYKEIAELKGLSVGAVKAHINRAIVRLTPKVLSVIA